MYTFSFSTIDWPKSLPLLFFVNGEVYRGFFGVSINLSGLVSIMPIYSILFLPSHALDERVDRVEDLGLRNVKRREFPFDMNQKLYSLTTMESIESLTCTSSNVKYIIYNLYEEDTSSCFCCTGAAILRVFRRGGQCVASGVWKVSGGPGWHWLQWPQLHRKNESHGLPIVPWIYDTCWHSWFIVRFWIVIITSIP